MLNYTLKTIDPHEWDTKQGLFVYTIGYERRSSFLRNHLQEIISACAIDYESGDIGHYKDNKKLHNVSNDRSITWRYNTFASELEEEVRKNRKFHDEPFVVKLDVSCLDRTLLSLSLITLALCLKPYDRIDILYTPAKFQEPPLFLSPLRRFGAATPQLAGSIGDPYRDRTLVMGLGYEYGAALNVIDIIEPQYSHFFHPRGPDERFVPFVRKANFDFDFGPGAYDVSEYDMLDPVSIHGRIRDLIFSMSHQSSIIIVPFGPKIFGSVCALLALNNRKNVSFMRYTVESFDYHPVVDSSGDVIAYGIDILRSSV